MEINFPTRSKKISPTRAVTYPRHVFADREVKKIKDYGEKLPTKVDILKVYYCTFKTITTHPKLWIKLN